MILIFRNLNYFVSEKWENISIIVSVLIWIPQYILNSSIWVLCTSWRSGPCLWNNRLLLCFTYVVAFIGVFRKSSSAATSTHYLNLGKVRESSFFKHYRPSYKVYMYPVLWGRLWRYRPILKYVCIYLSKDSSVA